MQKAKTRAEMYEIYFTLQDVVEKIKNKTDKKFLKTKK